MNIKKFEDLDCWKSARKLTNNIYSLTKKREFNRDYGLSDQIRRAAVSTMANSAEGFATKSDNEFAKFLNYATRSAFEVQSHLYAALDCNYLNEQEFETAYDLAQDCANLCRGLIRYLKSKV